MMSQNKGKFGLEISALRVAFPPPPSLQLFANLFFYPSRSSCSSRTSCCPASFPPPIPLALAIFQKIPPHLLNLRLPRPTFARHCRVQTAAPLPQVPRTKLITRPPPPPPPRLGNSGVYRISKLESRWAAENSVPCTSLAKSPLITLLLSKFCKNPNCLRQELSISCVVKSRFR